MSHITVHGYGNIPVEINGAVMSAYDIDVSMNNPRNNMSALEITVTIPDPGSEQVDAAFDAAMENDL
jgi:hypothetical protein